MTIIAINPIKINLILPSEMGQSGDTVLTKKLLVIPGTTSIPNDFNEYPFITTDIWLSDAKFIRAQKYSGWNYTKKVTFFFKRSYFHQNYHHFEDLEKKNITNVNQKILNNIQVMLRHILPTDYFSTPLKSSMDYILGPNVSMDQVLSTLKTQKELSYLTIGNQIYTVINVIWLNDVLNHSMYSKLYTKFLTFEAYIIKELIRYEESKNKKELTEKEKKILDEIKKTGIVLESELTKPFLSYAHAVGGVNLQFMNYLRDTIQKNPSMNTDLQVLFDVPSETEKTSETEDDYKKYRENLNFFFHQISEFIENPIKNRKELDDKNLLFTSINTNNRDEIQWAIEVFVDVIKGEVLDKPKGDKKANLSSIKCHFRDNLLLTKARQTPFFWNKPNKATWRVVENTMYFDLAEDAKNQKPKVVAAAKNNEEKKKPDIRVPPAIKNNKATEPVKENISSDTKDKFHTFFFEGGSLKKIIQDINQSNRGNGVNLDEVNLLPLLQKKDKLVFPEKVIENIHNITELYKWIEKFCKHRKRLATDKTTEAAERIFASVNTAIDQTKRKLATAKVTQGLQATIPDLVLKEKYLKLYHFLLERLMEEEKKKAVDLLIKGGNTRKNKSFSRRNTLRKVSKAIKIPFKSFLF